MKKTLAALLALALTGSAVLCSCTDENVNTFGEDELPPEGLRARTEDTVSPDDRPDPMAKVNRAAMFDDEVAIFIDGVQLEFDMTSGYPRMYNGVLMAPLDAVMEKFGASVVREDALGADIVQKGGITLVCPLGSAEIIRNGTVIPNETASVAVDDIHYVPIRIPFEALDATCVFEEGQGLRVSSPGCKDLVYNIEHAPATVANYWAAWTDALNLLNTGDFANALTSFTALAPSFIPNSDSASNAVLFKHLAECYLSLGQKPEAAECFLREAEYWDVTPGQAESAKAARRKASFAENTVQIYAKTTDPAYMSKASYGVKFEPASGIYLGVTIENADKAGDFASLIGRDVAGYLVYNAEDFNLNLAKRTGKLLQCGIQPADLADLASITEEDPRYVKMAQDIERTGIKVLIRFACEMNDNTSKIFTTDYELYKSRFRIVSNIFKKYAPNTAVMVWSPNFYPEETMELYYPGDEYVDYVGISAYAEYAPETDPLEMGIDRSRAGAMLDKLVSLYGYKKPFIISEGGASYTAPKTGADITDFSARQLADFYTYLPIRYPMVKAAFLYNLPDVNVGSGRSFQLKNNPTVLDAYLGAIRNPAFRSEFSDAAPVPSYYEIASGVSVKPEVVEISSFVKTVENDFAYVVYRVNGADVGVSYGIPYSVNIDFAPYAGQNDVKLGCLAFDSTGKLCAEKTYSVKVAPIAG